MSNEEDFTNIQEDSPLMKTVSLDPTRKTNQQMVQTHQQNVYEKETCCINGKQR